MRGLFWYMAMIILGLIFLSSPLSATSNYDIYSISLSSFSPYYTPSLARVQAGLPIMWINATASPHTITHDACITNESCAFDSGRLGVDASFSLYSLKPGVYPYHCRLHPIMRGTLIVTEQGKNSMTPQISARYQAIQ